MCIRDSSNLSAFYYLTLLRSTWRVRLVIIIIITIIIIIIIFKMRFLHEG